MSCANKYGIFLPTAEELGMTIANDDATESHEPEIFDFVIVGAGPSCMGLLHRLLSEYKLKDEVPFTIAVIDPGIGTEGTCTTTEQNDSQLPRHWFRLAHESGTIHCGVTDKNRVIDIPMGSGRGGTSRINASLCIPPSRHDFVTWPEPWKSELMQAVNQIQECLYDNSALFVSHVGAVEQDHHHHNLPNPYIPTADNPIPWKETIFPSVAHHIPCTVDPISKKRRDYYTGLLEPLLQKHSHLTNAVKWMPGRVERLLFEENQVIGVEYDTGGGTLLRQLYSLKQVILCAGAIESPALLLSSGVGLKDDVVTQRLADYPGAVGRNLRDHVMLPRAILTQKPSRLSPSTNGVQSLYQLRVDKNLFQVGIMDAEAYTDILPHLVAGLVRYRITHFAPAFNQVLTGLSAVLFRTTRLILLWIIAYTPIYYILLYYVRTVTVFHMNAESNGRVTVKLKPERHPVSIHRRRNYSVQINLAYTGKTESIDDLRDGWIAAGTVCPEGIEIFPGPLIRTMFGRIINQKRFRKFAQAASLSYYHLYGTCKMKTKNGGSDWVVDSCLRLRGIKGISICDASVFPSTVSAPCALTCAGVGRVFASILLSKHACVKTSSY